MPPMRMPLALVVLVALLAGCGHKGPLYLPDSKPGAQKPAAKPAAKPATKPEEPRNVGDQ